MARTLFLLLLLLNALAFAGLYFRGDARADAGREPARREALAADRVRLVAAAAPAEAAPGDRVCRAYEGTSVGEAEDIVREWARKMPAASVVAQAAMPPAVFEIVIAGLSSRAIAQARMAELKKLDVGAGLAIREEAGKGFSVSISSHAGLAAAEAALQAMVKRGVRSATVVESRPAAARATVEVRGTEADLALLPELAAARDDLTPAECATP